MWEENEAHSELAIYKKQTPLIALYNCAFNFRVFITFLQNVCFIRHITCNNHTSYEFVCILYAHKKYFHNS